MPKKRKAKKAKGQSKAAPKSKQSSAPDKTRELLINAAKSLFADHGFDGTTVKQLADRAGVNIGLVSYHFGGKEGLYRACVEQFGKSRLQVAKRVLISPANFEELRVRLQMFVNEMLECAVEEPEITCIVQRDCEMVSTMVQDIFVETLLKVYTTLVDFIASAQKKSILSGKFDPQIAASCLFGALTSYSRTDRLSKKYFNRTITDPAYRKKLTEEICRIFVYGTRAVGD